MRRFPAATLARARPRLVIMAGGGAGGIRERALPVLSLLGKNLALQGPAGAGQHCKMANQIACAVGMVAWCEALAYAKRGVASTRRGSHGSISGGAAGSWALTNLGPRALSGNFLSRVSTLKHIRKDIGIAGGCGRRRWGSTFPAWIARASSTTASRPRGLGRTGNAGPVQALHRRSDLSGD